MELSGLFLNFLHKLPRIGPIRVVKFEEILTRGYRALIGRKGNLADFFCESALGEIVLERNRDLPRRVDL